MEATYQLVRNADIQGTNEKQPLHARVIPHGTRSITDMMSFAKSYSTLSTADVKASLQLISELLEQSLRDGYNVELDGIGFFSVSLGCRPVMEKSEIRSPSVRFRNVHFRLNGEMKRRLSTMHLVRSVEDKKKSYTAVEREERLRRHLSRERYITSRTYCGLNGCTKYQALKDLKRFVAEGKLLEGGERNSRIYLKV